jgi:hypothetical protein
MRFRILFSFLLTALFVLASSCGTTANCPTCGTTVNGAYAVINVIPVPEHNATGEPGGPFNSFDISWIATPPSGGKSGTNNLFYVSDRIGVAVQVVDTAQDIAVNSIQGSNAVAGAGNGASPCAKNAAGSDIIPPIIDVFGNFTRYGCRTDMSTATPPGPTFHLITGFGANHNFGGFPGAQCCASRANGVNPMSGPDGLEVSADGNTLFVANGSSSVVVFDLTTMNLQTNPPTPPTILAAVPTGVSADYDGPQGISGCVASWNGEAGSATDCGDDRADEMSFDNVHKVLAVINGDPGLPFLTFIDMSHIVGKTGTVAQQHCLPIDQTLAYGPYPPGYTAATYPLQGSGTGVPPSLQLDPGNAGGSFNPPGCIIGQIYYDGAGGSASGGLGLTNTVPVDNVGATFPCPDPSNPHVFSGVSGSSAADGPLGLPGFGITPSGVSYTIPCHHGPILDYGTGLFCSQTAPTGNCAGAIAPAGLGGMVWDPNSGLLLLTNENSVATTNIGSLDVIDPKLKDTSCGGVSCGPVVINSIVMPNCMPTSITNGPGTNFLIGCADHDGEAFPPNEYIINFTPSNTITCTADPATSVNCIPIHNVGGVDETWYNPTDDRYYLAARDMLPSAVMGVIDAKTNQWLANMTTGSNAHSISVDPKTNHVFVPLQSGAVCTTLASYGCVGVVTRQ